MFTSFTLSSTNMQACARKQQYEIAVVNILQQFPKLTDMITTTFDLFEQISHGFRLYCIRHEIGWKSCLDKSNDADIKHHNHTAQALAQSTAATQQKPQDHLTCCSGFGKLKTQSYNCQTLHMLYNKVHSHGKVFVTATGQLGSDYQQCQCKATRARETVVDDAECIHHTHG